MKKFTPLYEKPIKATNPKLDLFSASIKQFKSEIFLARKDKRSRSPEKEKHELSKNDQRVTIYTDSTGFIVEVRLRSFFRILS